MKFFIIAMSFLIHFQQVNGQEEVTHLLCEYLSNPIGLDAEKPRFRWQLSGNKEQSTYRIIVGTDSVQVAKDKGVWDSGKITSGENLAIYNGTPLKPFTKYYWSVHSISSSKKSIKSAVANFETGTMGSDNWKGRWISDTGSVSLKPAPYFRKGFNATKKIKQARAYVVAAGLFELSINGEKVGDHLLDPMYTRFDKRNLYVTFDVTANLKKGDNAFGVTLGNGWYNHQSLAVWFFDKAPWRARPAFCMDVRVMYEDGSTEILSTDEGWKTHLSPITFNSIYTAEHYDSRLELKDWNKPGYNDANWSKVIIREAPSKLIVAQALHPIRATQKIIPVSVKQIDDKTYVFDLGRNISGITELKLQGPRNTVLRLKHGERLYADGKVDLSNIDQHFRPKGDADPFQTDIFTLKGEGLEVFKPKFNYKGFQYVEVSSSMPVKLSLESLNSFFMHSDVPVVGRIESSDALINKIWEATNNAYLSNLFGYPTDCPQREKNGWTGDAHIAIETGLFNFDGITIYEKWLDDHMDEQKEDGTLPAIIPTSGWGYTWANGVDWTSTIAIIPWNIYMYYGDDRLLRKSYESIKKYVANIEKNHVKDDLTAWGLGDWVPVKSKAAVELTSSIYLYVDARILAKSARLFNKPEDFKYYTQLAERVKTAINKKYLNPVTGVYGSGFQTELSMPLYWGIVPDEVVPLVAKNLADRVAQDNFHLDVGLLGSKSILNALSENGYVDVAYKVASQKTYPSWGWWIVNGATTLFESWADDSGAASQNHIMFGEISAWLYKSLGGINYDEQHPGFKNVTVKPLIVDGLDHFTATYNGQYGQISSSWKKEGESVVFRINVPTNSSARLVLPVKAGKKIYDQRKKAILTNTIKLASGSYVYELR